MNIQKITGACIDVCEGCLGSGSVMRDNAPDNFGLQTINGIDSVVVLSTAETGVVYFQAMGRAEDQLRFDSLYGLANILDVLFHWRSTRFG